MPAPLAKGIIITLSLIAALGIAILENPQVKVWIEEQRRKIAEALRSLGDDLDPQSRRQAEAFAYEGRLPGENAAAANAVAVATGNDTEGDAVSRRLSTRPDANAIDAEERRRLGRVYLASRNQEMLDRQRKNGKFDSPKIELEEKDAMLQQERTENSSMERRASNASFDHLVDSTGTLRVQDKDLPSAPTNEPETLLPAVSEMVRMPDASQLIALSAGASGLHAASCYANPFGDEFEMSDPMVTDRSATPKPPVPPKVALDKEASATVSAISGALQAQNESSIGDEDLSDLTFDEQLARALSLSLADSEEKKRAQRRREEAEDLQLINAILSSHRETERGEVVEQQRHPHPDQSMSNASPLVDISSGPYVPVQSQQSPFNQDFLRPMSAQSPSSDEELYTLSPQLRQVTPAAVNIPTETPYDPVRDAAATREELPSQLQETMWQELCSHRDEQPQQEQLIQIDNTEPAIPISKNLSAEYETESESLGFTTDSETDDFASLPDMDQRPASRVASDSEDSGVEVEDVEMDGDDSDDDGIRTPGSWTDVGSDVGESERSENEAGDAVRI